MRPPCRLAPSFLFSTVGGYPTKRTTRVAGAEVCPEPYHPRCQRSQRPSHVDRSIKECVGAFVVPISSRCCFKTSEPTPAILRHARRIEKYRLCIVDRVRQRAEQRQVVFAPEEYNLSFRLVRQHSEIFISICLATALVGGGTRAKRNVVGRRQKIGTNQAPACG
jgi:hypothetical protein